MNQRLIVLVSLLACGLLPLTAASKKKEARKARKAQMEAAIKARNAQMEAANLRTELKRMGPLPAIGNAPLPPMNKQLRLSAGQLATAAAEIDRHVRSGLTKGKQQPNPPANDEVFVRRIYLDAAGRIPTSEEAEKFLNDRRSDKRARLIDELLLSAGYRSHQFNWFADMLRFKSGIKRANFGLYQRWLKDGIMTNRGWDRTVYGLLTAEGSLASNGASGYLLRDTGMPLDSLSNTLTLFLGANVSCAQCHDHPLADWTQREFYEMAAFFGAADVSSRDPRKVGNKIKDQHLSKQDVMHAVAQNMYRVKTGPKNLLKFPEDYAYDDAKPGSRVDPKLVAWEEGERKGDAYDVDLGRPKNYRDSFAKWMTHPENPRFAANIANRLWQRMFGIAVKEPIEDLDDLDAASNPALLRHLAGVVVSQQFDLREFQRIVFNTRAYQSAANSTPAIGDIDDYLFPGPVLRRMTAEQAWDSILTLGFGAEIDGYQTDFSHQTTRFAFDYDNSSEAAVRQRTMALKQAGYLNGSKKRLGENDLVDKRRVPQRFGRSYVLRASELTQPAREDHFLRMFGQSSRDLADDGSREGNIPQTLMLMNGDFQSLLTGDDSRLMRAASQTRNKSTVVEVLYQAFFSRAPTSSEQQTIRRAMTKGTTREELAWTLFNTPEFLFIQ